jgi:cystathionine gamma-synthase
VELARISEEKFGSLGERCLLFPSNKIAASCRAFLLDRSRVLGLNPTRVRLIQFLICAQDRGPDSIPSPISPQPSPCTQYPELHIVLFPADIFPLAKEFWQHTGTGISSRLADFCLSALNHDSNGDSSSINSPPHSLILQSHRRHPSKNKHYAVRSSIDQSAAGGGEILGSDQQVYLEERYGRNMPVSLATSAKRAMRLRIAGVLRDGPTSPVDEVQVELGPSMRGVKGVTKDDVYLFPTGMSAIWNAHQMVMAVRPPAKSVCFGFPYLDTLKILQKWGEGCYFLGHGLDSSLDELEALLDAPTPIQSLFTEFPSNPLLRSADLPRIRALADKYGFLVVVDETIGNFVNVQVLPWADVVVSSLSKVFSGDSNVMGGRCASHTLFPLRALIIDR